MQRLGTSSQASLQRVGITGKLPATNSPTHLKGSWPHHSHPPATMMPQKHHSAVESLFVSSIAQNTNVKKKRAKSTFRQPPNDTAVPITERTMSRMWRSYSSIMLHNSRQEKLCTLQDTETLLSLKRQTYLHKTPSWCKGEWGPRPPQHGASLCLHPKKQILKPKTKVPPTESTVLVSSHKGFWPEADHG